MAECPTCGDEFKGESGVKVHHTKTHGESIAGVESECEHCGESFRHSSDRPGKFCCRDCKDAWQKEGLSGKGNPNYTERVTVECANCGESLERSPTRVERSENHFCDTTCMGEWRSENVVGENHPNYVEPIETECKACGTTVERMEHYAKRHDTYCEECRETLDTPASQETRTVECECDWCGDVFEVAYYHAEHTRFCNDGCYGAWKSENYYSENNPNWRGGKTHYAPGWTKELRCTIRARDGYECQDCGVSQDAHIDEYGRKLEVHHIRKAKSFDKDDVRMHDKENLITLCKKCHWKWEALSPLRPM